MKYINKTIIISAVAAMGTCCLSACDDDNYKMKYPPRYDLTDLPVVEGVHSFKAPLYWSVYEYCWSQERAGVSNENMDITAAEWDKILDWVARDFKPHGYDMVCTDGWIPLLAKDGSPYMTHYGSMAIKDLVAKAKAKGLRVGIYDNPMWLHCPNDTKIPGTDYTTGSLRYNGVEAVNNPKNDDLWFWWGVSTHPGAREWIDGFFKHYKELGVEYIRMDFLSWYEDGTDRGMGIVGRGYGRENYARYLAYIAESAKKYGIFTSLVMPHLYNDAEVEKMYGNMVRIVADTGEGKWNHVSANDRGRSYATWPHCNNQFDGFTYWSHLAGRENVILDGDFIRLNTLADANEKQTVISLQLMAGGPVTIADQYSTIGDNTSFYCNDELLALNADRFVGKPLSDVLNSADSNVWYGQMSNGDYVVGLFNRDESSKSFDLPLSRFGIEGSMNARDLWKHADEGSVSAIKATVPAHGCKIIKLTK